MDKRVALDKEGVADK